MFVFLGVGMDDYFLINLIISEIVLELLEGVVFNYFLYICLLPSCKVCE